MQKNWIHLFYLFKTCKKLASCFLDLAYNQIGVIWAFKAFSRLLKLKFMPSDFCPIWHNSIHLFWEFLNWKKLKSRFMSLFDFKKMIFIFFEHLQACKKLNSCFLSFSGLEKMTVFSEISSLKKSNSFRLRFFKLTKN